MMAAISLVGVRLWSSLETRLPTSSGNRLLSPARRTSPITCLNGPQSSDSDSKNFVDWDVAWKKLKEKKHAPESVLGTEITNVKSSSSEFEGKDLGLGKGLDKGPRLTKWGGSVRGGKYQLGEGADRILEFWGNGDAMLYAAMAVIVLMFVLLPFRPAAPM
eukprot:c12788_g1_i1 orf=76-558(+)